MSTPASARASAIAPPSVNHVSALSHDFRNPGTGPARWLGIASPAGLDRYFEEILALVAAGNLSEEELRRLRLRYDTEEPENAPPGHWSEQR